MCRLTAKLRLKYDTRPVAVSLTGREMEPLNATGDAGQLQPPWFKTDEAERQFHPLFVRQEDWEAQRPGTFMQLATGFG